MRPERGAGQTELGAGLVDLLPGVGGLRFPVGGPGCKFLLEAIKLFLECENPSDGLRKEAALLGTLLQLSSNASENGGARAASPPGRVCNHPVGSWGCKIK